MTDDTQTLDGLSPAQQQQLTNLLDQYLQQIEEGQSPDPDQLLAAHPTFAPVLQRYLASLGVLHQAAQGMQLSSSAQMPVPLSPATCRRLGDYEIRRQIGRGGMGIVYEARQISLDRRVALKVLPFAAVLDQRQIARFRREAQAAAQLHHPHIVPVFGVGCEEGVHYYSMQLVDGQSIDRVLANLKQSPSDVTVLATQADPTTAQTLPQRSEPTVEERRPQDREDGRSVSAGDSVFDRRYIHRVAELGVQAASALQHAHDYGVIHRDIKPSNLMMDREGKLWITDFGLAYVQTEADVTATGDIVGTLRYMSPEQASGATVVDQRTDIYSLGISLYEMLTLRHALPTKDRQLLLNDIENVEPVGMRKVNHAIPLDLETIILKAMSKDRDQRYARAQELADDLQRFLDGKPTLARRPTLLDKGAKWALRHRSLVACLLVMFTVALLATTTSAVLIHLEQKKTQRAQQKTQQAWEQRFHEARLVLDDFGELALDLSMQARVQREMLTRVRRYYRQYAQELRDDSTLQSELAVTHIKIGRASEQLGDADAAIDSYREALRAYQTLAASEPSHRVDEALSLNNLGHALTRTGRSEEALACYQSALSILNDLRREDAANREVQAHIALAEGNLGLLAAETGSEEEARRRLLQAIAIRKDILAEDPTDIDNRIRLASHYHNLSDLLVETDLEQAYNLCQTAIEVQEAVHHARSGDLQPQADLALSYNNLGAIESRRKNLSAAADCYKKAIYIGQRLAMQAHDQPQHRLDLAITWNNLAQNRAKRHDPQGALKAFREASALLNDLVPHLPHNALLQASLGGALYNQALVHMKLGQTNLAADRFTQAIAAQRHAVECAPSVARYATCLQLSLTNYGELLKQLGDEEQARKIKNELVTLNASMKDYKRAN